MRFLLVKTPLLLLLLLLPVPCLLFFHQEEKERLMREESALYALQRKALKRGEDEALHEAFQRALATADPFYVEKELALLEGETHLHFVRRAAHRNGNLQESEIALEKPVLVGLGGLKELLVRLEGVAIEERLPPPGRPPMQLVSFELKKRGSGEEELYAIDCTSLIYTEAK